MAFEKLRTIAGRQNGGGLPASVTLSSFRRGLPQFWIALAQWFAEQHQIEAGQKFDLLIGTEEDRGVVQLHPNPNGILVASKTGRNGLRIRCGFVEQFGTLPQCKQFCAAEILDGGAIEITLPAWAVEP